MMGGLGPAPFSAMLLADLGADIVRVDRVDEVGAPLPGDAVLRRSQRSIAIDAKSERGRDVIRSLADRADAFVDVFRPGVAERLGIGPDDLLARNRRLVYARMTGYGQDGPLAQAPGHDINYLALSGALHAIGTADAPVPPLNIIGDYGGGMLLAIGLLSGILDARRSGTGQVVDVAMLDGAIAQMAFFYGMLAQGMWRDRRHANVLDGGAHYYRVYETADGGHFSVGAIERRFYDALCERLHVRVPHDEGNAESWEEHGRSIAARFRERSRADWETELTSTDACATPVLSLSEAPQHPHNVARRNFVEVAGVVQPAPTPRFSRTPASLPGNPAICGDSTVSLLRSLGLSADTIDGLLQDGVARQSEVPASARPATSLDDGDGQR